MDEIEFDNLSRHRPNLSGPPPRSREPLRPLRPWPHLPPARGARRRRLLPEPPRQVPPDIAECSAFRAATALTLSDMMDLALTIDPREGIDRRSYR